MAQQVGSGAAPAAREAEGRAAEARTAEARTAEAVPGGAPATSATSGGADPDQNGSGTGLGRAGQAAQDTKASRLRGWLRRNPPAAAVATAPQAPSVVAAGPELDLASNDPLVGYLLSAASAVDITGLQLKSSALETLRQAGVVLVVPLISSGSLVGLLSLGPRRSERGYSTDDLRLLNSLAGYAAPAMRVGQLVRQQQAEARQRERIEQELKIAQIIQQQVLPKSLPDLPSWHVAAFYRPARTVGGDFYDFIPLPDGRVMFVVGDVTDKGVPAALVMASTHALLRAAAPRLISPGQAAGGGATSRLVLNFGGLEYMNSGGIGMLITLLVRANRQHQQLAAYGLSEHYREIFELTRLDEAITIYDSEESALTGVAR